MSETTQESPPSALSSIDPNRLHGLRSAARHCGVSPNTVRNWMLTGRLPYTEGNGRYYIDQADLDRIVDQREALQGDGEVRD